MAFDWHGYSFEGAFPNPSGLKAHSGVYIVFCKTGENWTVLDVGEAGDVRARILGHERKPCWTRNCRGSLFYAAHYTPGMTEAQRRQIETRIRSADNPPCGEQ